MNAKDLVASWLDGRAKPGPELSITLAPRVAAGLAAKLRRAYAWITTSAIVCPYHDIELGEPITLGRGDARVDGPQAFDEWLSEHALLRSPPRRSRRSL